VLRRRVPSLLLALLFGRAARVPGQNPPDTTKHGAMTNMRGMSMDQTGSGLRMPPMPAGMGMMPILRGMEKLGPSVTPFLPGAGVDPATLPEAKPGAVVQLRDGDTLTLEAMLVRRTIRGQTFVMYGYNGEYPGPLIEVGQRSTIVVRFTNHIDLPTTIHWHGVRLDNRFDGVPGVTQEPVATGGSFVYQVHFPDAGIYWYHPHVREDVAQNMGLYGNILVNPMDSAYYGPANRTAVLMLSDLLMDDQGPFPYGRESPDFALMGRFGNVFLVNGAPDYHLTVHRGDVVRFFLTDVSNTRTFNLTFGGAPIKVVAADIGKFEHEEWVPGVVIAPAQRYVVEVRFDSAGMFALTNRIQGINAVLGEFFPEVDTIGVVTVQAEAAAPDYGAAFRTLRTNRDVEADLAPYRAAFERPPDKTLILTVNVQGLPGPLNAFLAVDTMYYPPVEWNDGMPEMNWVATGHEVRWILRDAATGRENMDIGWHFRQGSVVKIRLFNDPTSAHPMNHPIHIHGQRFLVIARNGVPQENLAWKETVLVPVGSTVDILLDLANPGRWMLHCHISEHLEAGMHTVFAVDPDSSAHAP
jgi:FtsP/CotA-like multicopper oxidase with cupredoxin domain